jgi:tetratricopeptide (TPR) repeat protein
MTKVQMSFSEEMEKTLSFLAEFGHLKGVTDKLKGVMKEAKKGALTYADLRQPIQRLAKIPPEELLEVYKLAHTLFSEKKFTQASSVAILLSYLSPHISAFWRLAGSCYSNLGDEKAALGLFLYASMVNSLEVDNHLAALSCLIRLGLAQEALNYYNTAKEVLSEARKWDEIKKLDLIITKI